MRAANPFKVNANVCSTLSTLFKLAGILFSNLDFSTAKPAVVKEIGEGDRLRRHDPVLKVLNTSSASAVTASPCAASAKDDRIHNRSFPLMSV